LISRRKFLEQFGLKKCKISSYIAEIKQIRRSIENIYLDKTKEQLFDLFEMITSDMTDLHNHIEALKSTYIKLQNHLGLAESIYDFNLHQIDLLNQYRKISYTNKVTFFFIYL